ncbi:MAG: hypothetical protein L7H04_00300 [Vulcanisaeta sp.]|nr:hypothetical protein [Vulcanisaeta sp.]
MKQQSSHNNNPRGGIIALRWHPRYGVYEENIHEVFLNSLHGTYNVICTSAYTYVVYYLQFGVDERLICPFNVITPLYSIPMVTYHFVESRANVECGSLLKCPFDIYEYMFLYEKHLDLHLTTYLNKFKIGEGIRLDFSITSILITTDITSFQDARALPQPTALII